MDKSQIKEMTGNQIRDWYENESLTDTGYAVADILTDALGSVKEERERLSNALEEAQAESERLCAALRLAEQKCRRLVGTKTADHHIAILEECRACGARFSSATPTREQPHNDGCPFKILESASGQDGAGDWNWHRTCRKCGSLHRKIDGVWVGNHRSKCEFAKAKGGR